MEELKNFLFRQYENKRVMVHVQYSPSSMFMVRISEALLEVLHFLLQVSVLGIQGLQSLIQSSSGH